MNYKQNNYFRNNGNIQCRCCSLIASTCYNTQQLSRNIKLNQANYKALGVKEIVG